MFYIIVCLRCLRNFSNAFTPDCSCQHTLIHKDNQAPKMALLAFCHYLLLCYLMPAYLKFNQSQTDCKINVGIVL